MWLPGEHFAAALAFLGCGAVGLAAAAPELAGGTFSSPRVIAVAHLFVLGWLVPSIFGALCQFLPVAAGRPLWSRSLAQVSFVAHVVGVATFVGALLASRRPVLYLGAALLTVSFVSFAVNLALTLASGREHTLTWWALAGAAVFLAATPAFGVTLAMNLHGDAHLAHRYAIVATHAHVALIGFMLLVVVGVAHKLLPMFLLSHGASERPARIAVALLFSGAAILALPIRPGEAIQAIPGGALAAGGVLAFVVQAALFFRRRKRRSIDPGMRLAAVGVLGLVVAVLLAPFALTLGLSNVHLLATYFVVLIGALALFVAGHYLKIIPFIVWYHRFGPLVGTRKVPRIAELYSERTALIAAALLVAGWLTLALGTLGGWAPVVRGGATLFLAGAGIEAVLIAKVALRKVTP